MVKRLPKRTPPRREAPKGGHGPELVILFLGGPPPKKKGKAKP